MFSSASACFDVVYCKVGRLRFQWRLAGLVLCVHFGKPACQLDLIHLRHNDNESFLAVCRKVNRLQILGPTAFGFGGKQTHTHPRIQRHNKSESWNLFQSRRCHTALESLFVKRSGLFDKDLFDQNRKKVGLLAWIEVLLRGEGD